MSSVPTSPQRDGAANATPSGPSSGAPAERIGRVWRAWLTSLAHDSDAATAAASLYVDLSADGREAWLDALAEDAPRLGVDPAVVYGPLMAVETDPGRRDRIVRQAGATLQQGSRRPWALTGRAAEGFCVAVIAHPLYPGFARLTVARFHRARGVDWIRDVPIAAEADMPVVGTELEGCTLRASPIDAVIDELAHSVVAHVRAGRAVSETLRAAAGLLAVWRESSDVVE